MLKLDAGTPVHLCDGVPRRTFLQAGALGLVGLSLPDLFRLKASGGVRGDRDVSCIMLMLVGAPSQLDTWDVKPDAPREIRGPYAPIPTNVAGIRISEIFPRTARHADKFALLRSVYYSGVAVHDAGHQVIQTGRLFEPGFEYPHVGSVAGFLKGTKAGVPPHVLLPRPIATTGGNLPHGQTAGFLGSDHDPVVPARQEAEPDVSAVLRREAIGRIRADQPRDLGAVVGRAVKRFEAHAGALAPDPGFDRAYALVSSTAARAAFDLSREPDAIRDRYGRNRFGQSCLLARRLVEAGVRFVTVNMFETVFNEVTWDSHGTAPFSTLDAYGSRLGPMFDHACASLLDDLASRGLLETTLVVAAGEFGRTPRINAAGGRDHWTQCWTVMMAGGGVKGGQVIGASDEIGAYPKDRPIPAPAVPATILHALGIEMETELARSGGGPIRVAETGVKPVTELF